MGLMHVTMQLHWNITFRKKNMEWIRSPWQRYVIIMRNDVPQSFQKIDEKKQIILYTRRPTIKWSGYSSPPRYLTYVTYMKIRFTWISLWVFHKTLSGLQKYYEFCSNLNWKLKFTHFWLKSPLNKTRFRRNEAN